MAKKVIGIRTDEGAYIYLVENPNDFEVRATGFALFSKSKNRRQNPDKDVCIEGAKALGINAPGNIYAINATAVVVKGKK